MNNIFFLLPLLIQIVFFIPFYIIYIKDCKKIGKKNLAVSLTERFFAYLLVFPIWFSYILQLIDYFLKLF